MAAKNGFTAVEPATKTGFGSDAQSAALAVLGNVRPIAPANAAAAMGTARFTRKRIVFLIRYSPSCSSPSLAELSRDAGGLLWMHETSIRHICEDCVTTIRVESRSVGFVKIVNNHRC
jgi:hypothetical protein